MQSVAQSWLIYHLTHSALLLGIAGFANQIPSFILAPLGGVFADRHNRHRILVVTQVFSMVLALTLAALTLLGIIQVWQILLLSVLFGVVNAFDIPARQAFMVEMVGKDDLVNGIALNSSIVNGSRMVGPAIAAVLVVAVGEGWCFFANGISYIAVIMGLLWMSFPYREETLPSHSAMEHLVEGFQFVAQSPPIGVLLSLLGVVSLMGVPYTVLMPLFADEVLHAGPSGLGILMAMAGLGAFLGALALTVRRGVQGLGRWIVLSSLAFGASLIAFAQSQHFWLSAFLLIPVGFSMIAHLAASNTLIQCMVPDQFRGRVMAAHAMVFIGMTPLGALFAGLLAKPLGAPVTVMIGGVFCILSAAFFWRKMPCLEQAALE